MEKKMTYTLQLILSFGIVLTMSVLGYILDNNTVQNFGWVLIGILFIIHPTTPKRIFLKYGEKSGKLIMCASGILLILIGLGI